MRDEAVREEWLVVHPSAFILTPGAQGRIQTFNLWFVGPALRQLSYSGGNKGRSLRDEGRRKLCLLS